MSITGLPPPLPPPSPPQLDPPFRGYIETTYDSLLVFEAARRGLIPRVTRRLIERERGMVQSGAVFVFDEQESGIKRWTDGLVWSPSRILGNFLVYRETDKRPTPSGGSSGLSGSPNQGSPSGTPSGSMVPPGSQYAESSQMALQQQSISISTSTSTSMGEIPILAQGAIQPRSASEGGLDRQLERQLVGSLTNSHKFKEGGLVKKTMSVSIGNYSQHMISYYAIEDVMAGRLRTPSTIPELASLQISQEYLQQQNFRFPPMIEVGQDGITRYRGEAEEPMSPNTPMSGLSLHAFPDPYDPFGHPHPHSHGHMQLSMDPPRHPHHHPHGRGISHTHPSQHIPLPLPGPSGYRPPSSLSPGGYGPPPGSASGSNGSFFDPNSFPSASTSGTSASAQPIPIQRQVSAGGGPHRPSSSSRSRYDPYSQSASPRIASMGISPIMGGGVGAAYGSSPNPNPLGTLGGRRQSVPHPHSSNPHPSYQPHQPQLPPQHEHQQDYYQQYDVKPVILPTGVAAYPYQPPATAPGSYAGGGGASGGDYYGGGGQNPPGSAPASGSTGTAIGGGLPAISASPIIAYTAAPTGPDTHTHAHTQPSFSDSGYPSGASGASGPTWQTTPAPSAPLPGSQSRLVPVPNHSPTSTSYGPNSNTNTSAVGGGGGRSGYTSAGPSSAGLAPGSAGRPPSSSGSSGSAGIPSGRVGAGVAGGDFAYAVPAIPHGHGGEIGARQWDTNHLQPGQYGNPIGMAMSNPLPLQHQQQQQQQQQQGLGLSTGGIHTGHTHTAGSGVGVGMGGQDVVGQSQTQYIAGEDWRGGIAP